MAGVRHSHLQSGRQVLVLYGLLAAAGAPLHRHANLGHCLLLRRLHSHAQHRLLLAGFVDLRAPKQKKLIPLSSFPPARARYKGNASCKTGAGRAGTERVFPSWLHPKRTSCCTG